MKHKWADRAVSVSLALWVITGVLWAWGYWRHTDLTWFHDGRLAGVAVRSGNFILDWGSSPQVPPQGKSWAFRSEPPDPLHREVQNRGVVHSVDKRSGVNFMLVYVPLWLPFVTFGLAPAYRMIVARRTRYRVARRRCPACSYDITGNTSGVCPECGTSLAPYHFPLASPAPRP